MRQYPGAGHLRRPGPRLQLEVGMDLERAQAPARAHGIDAGYETSLVFRRGRVGGIGGDGQEADGGDRDGEKAAHATPFWSGARLPNRTSVSVNRAAAVGNEVNAR